jgi:hypothetical protein
MLTMKREIEGLGWTSLEGDDLLEQAGAKLAEQSLTVSTLASILGGYTKPDREKVTGGYTKAGGNPDTLAAALMNLKEIERTEQGALTTVEWRVPWWYSTLSTVSGAVCFYHGYKRNDSFGWALGWGLLGMMFPIITPIVAVAQKPGFAKPKFNAYASAPAGWGW